MPCERVLAIVKTVLGMEEVAASVIEETVGVRCVAKPNGYPGIVLVCGDGERSEVVDRIRSEVPEAERVIPVEEWVPSDIESIVEAAKRVVDGRIGADESFAVRTVRRGRRGYTSVDVNIRAGAAVKEVTGASVNLRYPDKIVQVEILGDHAAVSLLDGRMEWRKLRPGKPAVLDFIRKVAVAHIPYLGPPNASREMGVRVGREAQTFEVKELVVTPVGLVDANGLRHFLNGVFEGVRSRFEIQRRAYGRDVHRVPVYLQDIYGFVRERRREPIIVFEPEGEPVPKVADEIYKLLQARRRVNVMVGSREGIPKGVFRFSNLVLDICPGVTISTDYAASSALIALANTIEWKLLEVGGEENLR